ncbi:hypothetical protein GEV33_004813 [Tenebrio molitor]|uniref:Uncharacterized protein n=1 Tax=Tenebrio molitor TaxID=7067 RepID=A0A8J6HPI9_TENMO|nr:hypothetical protein GEV33_004813 [Tenebrio molitor]
MTRQHVYTHTNMIRMPQSERDATAARKSTAFDAPPGRSSTVSDPMPNHLKKGLATDSLTMTRPLSATVNDHDLDMLMSIIEEDLGCGESINNAAEAVVLTRSQSRREIAPPAQQQQQQQQTGAGAVLIGRRQTDVSDTFQFFTKGVEREVYKKRFALTTRWMEFTFKPIAGAEHPLQWLKSAFRELLAHICRGFDADDLVGLELENCAFPSRPVGVSFRKLSQLTVDVVLSTLAKVLQSIAAFCTNDRLSVRVDAIRPPTGHGFSAVYGRCVTFNEFSLSKNSIFVIQNDDSSCLAAALVVAVEYQKCGLVGSVVKRKFSGVRGRELWSQGARAFDSNGHGGRYEHVELFQNYFTEYTIVVYSSRSGTTRGQVCFNKHETSKLCDKLKRCDRCMTYFWPQKNKQHVCGVSYCLTCRADKPVRHLCYMVPNNLESTKKLDRSKFLLCFYDLETRQEKQISANMFRHESNLCISQQVCQACITNQEEICERCGVRENVFYGTDSVERFLSHLVGLTGALSFRRCVKILAGGPQRL